MKQEEQQKGRGKSMRVISVYDEDYLVYSAISRSIYKCKRNYRHNNIKSSVYNCGGNGIESAVSGLAPGKYGVVGCSSAPG
jgi:hypothetical protein